jgi:hypothetical protein
MVNLDELDDLQLAQLRDAINQQMLKRRRTSGLRLNELLALLDEVKTTLRDQGKEWRSLERWQYIDGKICFWLNPVDQSRYTMGWFSIDELIQWSYDLGPVMSQAEENELDWDESRAFDLAA